jgi:aminopeptidase N
MKKTRLLLIAAALLTAILVHAQRLPGNVAPDHYQVTLAPNFDKENFAGEETIQVRVLRPTSNIVLNSLDLEFQEATIASAGVVQTAKVSLDKEKQTATLAVEKPLAMGPASIHIRYTGILNKELRGFYLGHADGRKYAATQFEATDARRAFPSFDEPAMKATFEISTIVDKGDTAISNSRIVSDTPGPEEGKHTIKFETTPKMSSYLVALVVGEFEYVEGSAEGVPIRVWTTPGKKQLAQFALATGEECIRYFNDYFGIKYPFGKLDLIGLPDFAAGAMENTGAITFRDALLLVDEKSAPNWQYKEIASVISHEIAHMWFGDLVTMQWWDDVWLNEGFATWLETKPLERWKPEWHMDLSDVLDTGNSLNLDSLQNTRPIHQAAETPDQIEELFDGIAYGKAAAVLRMLESYLGPETFRKGVRAYLKAHAYDNATESDFWSALTTASGKPVDRIMATFVNQPGAPLVSVRSECQGSHSTVTLSQQRFYYDRRLLEAGGKELWLVPVTLKDASGNMYQELLSEQQRKLDVPGCSSWFFANSGAAGYYRTEYESAEFHQISQVAEKNFTPAERIVLVRDAWAAVRSGRQPIGDFLALAEGLQAERNASVIQQMDTELDYIGEYLVSDSDRPQYQAWIRGLLEPILKEVGWQPASSDSPEQKDLRAYVIYTLGYTGRDPQVLTKVRELAGAALRNPSAVDPSLMDVVFSLAAFQGDAAFYDQLMDRLKPGAPPQQYYRYFYTLSRFRDPVLLQRTLDYALSPAVRSQDALNLISAVMDRPAGRELAWNYVRSHWEQITQIMGGYNTGGLVATTGAFCDARSRDEVKQFFSEHLVPAAERSLRQALERVSNCIDLKTHATSQLARWLGHSGSTAAGRQ